MGVVGTSEQGGVDWSPLEKTHLDLPAPSGESSTGGIQTTHGATMQRAVPVPDVLVSTTQALQEVPKEEPKFVIPRSADPASSVTVTTHSVYDAPIERVFDLARSVDAYQALSGGRERAVGGVTSGTMSKGDFVEWEARAMGFKMNLSVGITELQEPTHIRDELIDMPLFPKWLQIKTLHDHRLENVDGRTHVTDTYSLELPLGLSRLWPVRKLMEPVLRKFLRARSDTLKEIAEGEQWKAYLR